MRHGWVRRQPVGRRPCSGRAVPRSRPRTRRHHRADACGASGTGSLWFGIGRSAWRRRPSLCRGNLVNAIFLGGEAAASAPLAEAARVLAPGGALFARGNGPSEAELVSAGLEPVRPADGEVWRSARKPRPKGMGQWSHSRHAADGNAVSQDELVGPPRRVRWLAGPPQEISNMVTAGGRAFFAGVLARDAFNGLRLWERKLNPSPARGGFYYQSPHGSIQPIATDNSLLVLTVGMLRELDAATGCQIHEFPEAGLPTEVLLEAGTILAIEKTMIRAVDLRSGRTALETGRAGGPIRGGRRRPALLYRARDSKTGYSPG